MGANQITEKVKSLVLLPVLPTFVFLLIPQPGLEFTEGQKADEH